MTPDVMTGLLMILIVITASAVLAPLLVWLLPDRSASPNKV